MNVIEFWLSYQCINGKKDTKDDFYYYLSEEMIDNTYDWFMMWSAERRRKSIVDTDYETFDDNNPLFIRINCAPRCVIALHVTPNKKVSKKRDVAETQ